MTTGSDKPEDRSTTPDFAPVWAQCQEVPGWLKEGQAQLLYDEAQRLGAGDRIVEIGSHQGRSTVVLGRVSLSRGSQVFAIDPFVEGRLFGGQTTRDKFEQNIQRAGVGDAVTLIPAYSKDARGKWSGPVQLLYIDGKHDYWSFTDDLRWKRYLAPGGRILVHDSFSSIGVTLGILAHILLSTDVRYLRRSDSMALFELGRPRLADRSRILAEIPWWLRNVFLKVLLRLRLRSAARLFGHDSPYDPY